jgi:hypothetical protein
MKKIILTILLFAQASFANDCAKHVANSDHYNKLYYWGSSVDVYRHDLVSFAYPIKADEKVTDFSVEIENWVSFECYEVEISRDGPCFILDFEWSPGADYSGCTLKLLKGNEDLGSSEIYMSY